MQLNFCMQGNIKVLDKLILSFLTNLAIMPKIPKITRFQYLTNDMLDYLDFSYVHRPPIHESNPLLNVSQILVNDNFFLKKESRDQGSIIMFSYTKIF